MGCFLQLLLSYTNTQACVKLTSMLFHILYILSCVIVVWSKLIPFASASSFCVSSAHAIACILLCACQRLDFSKEVRCANFGHARLLLFVLLTTASRITDGRGHPVGQHQCSGCASPAAGSMGSLGNTTQPAAATSTQALASSGHTGQVKQKCRACMVARMHAPCSYNRFIQRHV